MRNRPSESAASAKPKPQNNGVGRAFMPDKPADLKNVGHKCPTY
ncbi:Cob(II)yrinic acid a,c-diamide reductase [Neisseria bacilliformis ATCC BAA-1200]|uniref:Cob(II)yrinic acid a,c-diamide reductase n=1 Tax=Neisseria bacilliformis ATCC BAA-1200 TaxID=888742 RepID=F2BFL4_9NEIS|nr:Cob(II)yrinic acid a,c-diamide reductase [Neisseria bacilliformis ATCC BAA-1200]